MINYFKCVNDIKIFAKNEKELKFLIQTIRIFGGNLGTGNGILKNVSCF